MQSKIAVLSKNRIASKLLRATEPRSTEEAQDNFLPTSTLGAATVPKMSLSRRAQPEPGPWASDT